MRFGIALAGAAAIALAWAAPAAAQLPDGNEPKEVAGRTFEDWSKDITHKDPSKREMAIRAILGFGPEKAYEAVPAMLTELRRHNPDYPIDTSVRVNLAMALGAILSNKKYPDMKLVKDAVTLLTRLLHDSQGIVKFRAAQALASFSTAARSAIPDVLPLLRDSASYEVRQAGAMALGKIAVDKAGPTVGLQTALRGLLADPASGVRQSACQALGMLGPPSDATQKAALLKSLEPLAKKDADPVVKVWAHMAIMIYNGKLSEGGLEHITQLVTTGDTIARVHALEALLNLGPMAKDSIPALTAALADKETSVVGLSLATLGRMDNARALSALEAFAADPNKPEQLKKIARDSAQQVRKNMAGTGTSSK
jgi:HEAT repeat protein